MTPLTNMKRPNLALMSILILAASSIALSEQQTQGLAIGAEERFPPNGTVYDLAGFKGEESQVPRVVRRTHNPYLSSPRITAASTVPQIGEQPAEPLPEVTNIQPVGQSVVHFSMTVYEGLPLSRNLPRVEYPVAEMSKSTSLSGFSTGDDEIDGYILDSSRRYRIDPLLIYAQMGQESGYKTRAKSNKGASGLMQLMPATALRLGVAKIYDPKQNIEGGVKYMRILLDMFSGDLNLALAGYNAGEGAVIRYGYQIPPYNETREYVRRISARYRSISNATISRKSRHP